MRPKRIQRKRTKGWRIPPGGAVYVGRPTIWGNPFRPAHYTNGGRLAAVQAYRGYLERNAWIAAKAQQELRGRNLSCWCPLDQPCHADVLLEIANAEGLSK